MLADKKMVGQKDDGVGSRHDIGRWEFAGLDCIR